MKLHAFTKTSANILGCITMALAVLTAAVTKADTVLEPGLFHVSINLDDDSQSTFSISLIDDLVEPASQAFLQDRGVSQSPRLPDSLHFAGLAGALNLAIDTSNGRPLVQGIELAPREILRFVADDSGGIRGLYGRISIRLDF